MATSLKTSGKRKSCDVNEEIKKPACNFGRECYRKNSQHLKDYSHPSGNIPKDLKRQKLKQENLGNIKGFYLTTVQGIDDVYNDSSIAVGIEDILSDDCENLTESIQFNYMFDIPWLLNKYPESCREKPLLLVHGYTGKEKLDMEAEAMKHSNIDLVQAKLPIAYGTHHSKMMLLFYKDGLRIVIHTANLIYQDWHQKTQGVWISPKFKEINETKSEEKDAFKLDLIEYITAYSSVKLQKLVENLKVYDMTTANVHLIASVPGRHTGNNINKWGHLKLRKFLRQHGPSKTKVTKDWSVVGQFSSIGSLGPESNKWLCSEWLQSLSMCKDGSIAAPGKNLKLIYPTMENVRNSLEGYSAGGSLPYGVQTAMKQRYLKEFIHKWKSNDVGRTLASPHIKTYTRLSPDSSAAAWFLVTSSNLSKAAWGGYEKNQSQLMIRSYEIGVLMIPNTVEEDRCFAVGFAESADPSQEYIQLPFDVPLTPYSPTDKPWVWDIRYTKEDSHGKLWVPR